MLSPYFIIYAPLVTLLMKRKVFEKHLGEPIGKVKFQYSIFIFNILGMCFLSILSLLFIFMIDVLTTVL